jgi:hypothetical protein
MLTRLQFLATTAAGAVAPALPESQATSEPTFSPDVVRGDLDAVWSALVDVGADPFRTSKRSEVEALYRSTRASITEPLTTRQAWLTIAPVLGALNDGHVGLGFPDPLNAAPRRFPLHFALSESDGSLIVAGDRTKTIPPGSTVVSVDDIAAERFRSATLAAFGGQTATMHRTRVTMAGAWTSVALFGAGPTYRVRWIGPDGVQHSDDIAATPAPGASAPRPPSTPAPASSTSPAPTASSAAAPAKSLPYTYHTLRDGTVGFIDYRSCEGLDTFKDFLTATFAAIKAAPVRGLIIDIRHNGGGDSRLNDALWPYVSKKPFKQYGGVIIKACDRLKREYGHDRYVDIYGDEAWRAADGTILRFGMDPNSDIIVPPSTLDARYSGPVYLLISAQTFSSAMSCALAAKDYGLATIVGEETGEPVNSTGEIYSLTTPGIGLRASLTTKVFLSPKPHPDGQGVVPDIAVATTPADAAAGRDPVLERVLALIPNA